jgi:hypothetical protein
MKADLDPNYYIILQTIEEAGGSVETGKLRSRLKSQNRDVDKNILNKNARTWCYNLRRPNPTYRANPACKHALTSTKEQEIQRILEFG